MSDLSCVGYLARSADRNSLGDKARSEVCGQATLRRLRPADGLSPLPRTAVVVLGVVPLPLAGLDAVRRVVVAARFAWALVLFSAPDAVRTVVVRARLAVLLVLPLPWRAAVIVLLAPAFAPLAVLTAPRETVRAVSFAPDVAAEEAPFVLRVVLLTVALPSRLAACVFSMTTSAALSMLPRTLAAVLRAALLPVGRAAGLLPPNTLAIRSFAAETLPWATPLTLSLTRSAIPEAAPTTRLPGGTSEVAGCGCVGAVSLAAVNASPSSFNALRPSSARTFGKYSPSSSPRGDARSLSAP